MNANIETYNIINSPSKDKLIDAFKYAYEKDGTRVIINDVVDNSSNKADLQRIRLLSIGRESRSGYDFILEGYLSSFYETEYISCEFLAYYNASIRKGYIKVTRE